MKCVESVAHTNTMLNLVEFRILHFKLLHTFTQHIPGTVEEFFKRGKYLGLNGPVRFSEREKWYIHKINRKRLSGDLLDYSCGNTSYHHIIGEFAADHSTCCNDAVSSYHTILENGYIISYPHIIADIDRADVTNFVTGIGLNAVRLEVHNDYMLTYEAVVANADISAGANEDVIIRIDVFPNFDFCCIRSCLQFTIPSFEVSTKFVSKPGSLTDYHFASTGDIHSLRATNAFCIFHPFLHDGGKIGNNEISEQFGVP